MHKDRYLQSWENKMNTFSEKQILFDKKIVKKVKSSW